MSQLLNPPQQRWLALQPVITPTQCVSTLLGSCTEGAVHAQGMGKVLSLLQVPNRHRATWFDQGKEGPSTCRGLNGLTHKCFQVVGCTDMSI